MQVRNDHRLTRWIVIGLAVGAVIGLLTRWLPSGWQSVLVDNVYGLTGQIFLRLIQMLVVPIVFVSLLCGAQSLSGRSLGQVGLRALFFYLLTTATAVVIALAIANLFSLGVGADLASATRTFNLQAPSWIEVVLNAVPVNPFYALTHGNMLAIIVFALLLGFAIGAIKKEIPLIVDGIDQLQKALIFLIKMIMVIAPVGVAALIAQTLALQGMDVMQHLLAYFLVVIFIYGFALWGNNPQRNRRRN